MTGILTRAEKCLERYESEKRKSYMLASCSAQKRTVSVGERFSLKTEGLNVLLISQGEAVARLDRPYDSLVQSLSSFGEELYATVFEAPEAEGDIFFVEIFASERESLI